MRGARAIALIVVAAWVGLLAGAGVFLPAQAGPPPPPDASRLVGAIATAAAPAYPENDIRSLSQTLGGALRITSEAAAGNLGRVEGISAEGGAVSRPITIGARDAAGNARHVGVTDQRALFTVPLGGRWIDDTGAVFLVQRSSTTVVAAGAEEIQAVAAQGAGNSVLLLSWIVSSGNAAATTLAWESDESDAGISAIHRVPANAAWTSNYPDQWYETADNQALKLQVGAAATWAIDVRFIVR